MPQSLSKILLHVVFSTKDRRPLLRDGTFRTEMHRYLGGILKGLDCPPIIVGGVDDHVHLLCILSRTVAPADMVKEGKRSSSLWIKSAGRNSRTSRGKPATAFFSSAIPSLRKSAGTSPIRKNTTTNSRFRTSSGAC